MNYRTTCPHCASVFRLGADQLDAAQGWVQCSVCGAAFDARPSLLLEDGSPLPAAAEPGPAEASPPPETIAAAAAEPAAVTETAATAETTETAPGAEDAAATDIPRGIGQREATLDLDSIILIDPEIPLPDDPGPLPQFHAAPAYPPAAAPVAPATRIEYAAPLLDRPHLPPPPRRIRPWAWAVAGALLLVLLLAQTAYFLRDTLVSHLPQARPAFEQACAVLGCTLSLPKNLALLQIVGSDLQTESPARGTPAGDPLLRSDPFAASGRLKLTLTLGNRANHVQAWPVLVLTLTDQRNRALARRSFAPSEYLGDARRIAAGLPPHSEQALSLPLTVRDLAPMGFDLQLAY